MALSNDLRKRIIECYNNKEGSIRKLALRFKLAPSTVWELVKRYEKTGELGHTSPPGRTPKIGEQGLKKIEELIAKKNDLTLVELVEHLERQSGIKVCTGTIHNACRKLGLRYKKNAISGGTRAR
jgi:transposase